jgi:large subunit ribosomal protein L10
LVAALHQTFGEVNLVVVTHQSGLTVAESTAFRQQVREAGAGFRVSKNRLTRLALEGTKFEALQPLMTGPTGLATSVDPVAAAKVCVEFAKKNEKLTVVGGALGEQLLDIDGVQTLARLPSLDELRGRIVGLLQAPATKVAVVLQTPAGQLARVFGAYGSQGEAA